MLAPTLDGNRPRIAPIARVRERSVALDMALLFAAFGIAGVFFFQGGLEALVGGAVGALLGLRNVHWRNARLAGAISGAFAGLFAGALFAGFFHDALTAFF
ncbi:hypothetical protein [Terricaulis silvestris]|uniref:Uncharacterized protein n=1 Tax=Terricaulis silvestris TaxID=2686094 RepID=A0A6I6MRP0_9CAUL|nr:hypothetical protein [Terricaulis silvestris]QGZ95467.1 hypothetical protein DSM104635_02316 [Terricaulis silvestris]